MTLAAAVCCAMTMAVLPLVKYAKAHEDWNCLLITYDDEGTKEGIPVVPVWKWLMMV